MKVNYDDLPRWFIDVSLSNYQKQYLTVKYHIVESVKNRSDGTTKQEVYNTLSHELNMGIESIIKVDKDHKTK